MVALLVASSSCLLPGCNATESGCDSLPRIIGAFGAENNVGPPVSLAPDIRSQLPELREVRRVLTTNLAPSGEQIVIYDSNADDSDPHPKVALLVGGRVVKLLNGSDFNSHTGGFERYLSSCEVNLTRNERALAISISSGFDGAASAFVIIKWQSGEYRVVFNPMVGQGRMVFESPKLELWSSLWGRVRGLKSQQVGKYECVWCQHRYQVTEYLWRNGKFVKTGSYRTNTVHDPAEISGASLMVKPRPNDENIPATR
jgi:hypothetical protein